MNWPKARGSFPTGTVAVTVLVVLMTDTSLLILSLSADYLKIARTNGFCGWKR